MEEEKQPKLEIKIEFYEDDILLERAETYSFEMAETHLGCMERHYQNTLRQRELSKILKDEDDDD
jgi:hypothetical protein